MSSQTAQCNSIDGWFREEVLHRDSLGANEVSTNAPQQTDDNGAVVQDANTNAKRKQ